MLRWLVSLALVASVPAAVIPSVSHPRPETEHKTGHWSGIASWYGGGESLNSRVAMGHRFDPESLEAAMWDVPFGSVVKVTNLETGRSVLVRITDRGPARRLGNRVIDLTRGSFARLAPLQQGLIPVAVERVS